MTRRGGVAERDARILGLLAEGYDSMQMGAILGCSAATVKNQIGRLIKDAGARNRSHLVAISVARPHPDRRESPLEIEARMVDRAHRACLGAPTAEDYRSLRAALDHLSKVVLEYTEGAEVTPGPQLAPVLALRSSV